RRLLSDELYRAPHDLHRLPAGGGAEVVYAPLSRSARLLDAGRAGVLARCRGFATLERHASRAAPAGPGPIHPARAALDQVAAAGAGAIAAARAALDEMARAGLLLSAGELSARLRAGAEEEAPPPIATIGIPTRDRVPELVAALESHIDNALAHGRAVEYVVA